MTWDWDKAKAEGIEPSFVSTGTYSPSAREEFLKGFDAMNYPLGKVQPQQLHVADVLGLGRKFNGILLPRRATKTTSILQVLVGRCMTRPGYVAGFTTGINALKARTRFRQDVIPPIYRRFPDLHDGGITKIVQTAGMETINFENGSYFMVGKPHEDWFRSEAFDCIFIDEAGEADAETSEGIVVGALPTMDTRPGSQIIYAGTAADYRTGNVLWDTLQKTEDRRVALLEYGIDQHTNIEDITDWEQVEPVLHKVHPGIGRMTTIDDVRDNFEHMDPARFAREYLGLFGWSGETGGVVNTLKWNAAELKVTSFPRPPQHFAIGIAASPTQANAAIVAAWREGPLAHILVLESQPGVRWLAERAAYFSRQYRVPIAHDSMGVILVHTEEMARMKPRPRTMPFTMRNIATAAALFTEAVETGNLRHYGQEVLTTGALSARRRPIGAVGYGFGRRHPSEDITALEAAAIALRAFDESLAPRGIVILRPSA